MLRNVAGRTIQIIKEYKSKWRRFKSKKLTSNPIINQTERINNHYYYDDYNNNGNENSNNLSNDNNNSIYVKGDSRIARNVEYL